MTVTKQCEATARALEEITSDSELAEELRMMADDLWQHPGIRWSCTVMLAAAKRLEGQ